MKPIIFEIDKDLDMTLRLFVQDGKHSVVPKSELKKTPEGEYKLWSVLLNDQEVFWYGFSTEPNGRKIMLITPLKDKKDSAFYLSFLNKVKTLGAKELEGL